MTQQDKSGINVRINHHIQVSEVRLVGADGGMVGVVSVKEALKMAQEAGLDLVEVSPNAEPPVCKILDYGKFKYEQQKKKNLAKKKQKTIEIKEIKMRPAIEEHDYNTKMRHIHEFIRVGDKVKVTIPFRGREMMYQDLGMKVATRIIADTEEVAKLESAPKMEGRQIALTLAPK